jgi:hypothetical protein
MSHANTNDLNLNVESIDLNDTNDANELNYAANTNDLNLIVESIDQNNCFGFNQWHNSLINTKSTIVYNYIFNNNNNNNNIICDHIKFLLWFIVKRDFKLSQFDAAYQKLALLVITLNGFYCILKIILIWPN